MRTEVKMAHDGEFLREYGKSNFVVVSEALSIGRVKWDMVPIGKKGQNGVVFYMTTEQMYALCREIISGKFEEKIKADTGNYPSAYKYATGEDAALKLNIGGGKVGCRIQMQDAKNKVNYTMAVSMSAMEEMAKCYFLNTGLIPLVPGSYYASVVSAFEEGRKERSKFRKPTAEEVGEAVDVNRTIEEPEHDTKEDVAEKEPKKVETKSEEKAESESEKANYKIKVHGESALKKGFITFNGIDQTGKKVFLIFRPADAEKLNWFEQFKASAAEKETEITLFCEKKNDYLLYVGPAKK